MARRMRRMALFMSYGTTLTLSSAFRSPSFRTAAKRAISQRLIFSSTLSSSLSSSQAGEIPHNTTTTATTAHRDWKYVLNIAEGAARHAGSIMKQTTGRISVTNTKANVKDLVTESDVACQQIIRQTIESVFPDDLFLGEEDVPTGRDASVQALQEALSTNNNSEGTTDRLVWICDPIDGTTNFQAGLPLFGASIGVVALSETKEPELVVGVIYNPILDEMVSAIKGGGAFLNGKRLVPNNDNTTTTISLEEAMVNVGFPVTQESTLQASSRAVAALATQVRGLRMIASAAQVLSWLALDKMQCYISWNLNAWDIAAGMLIVRESGGCLLNFDGTEATISSRDMVMVSASGGSKLAKEILEILKENDCLNYTVVS